MRAGHGTGSVQPAQPCSSSGREPVPSGFPAALLQQKAFPQPQGTALDTDTGPSEQYKWGAQHCVSRTITKKYK